MHGNLFALPNIAIGYLLLRFAIPDTTKKYVSLLALVGMLMPLGILAELLLGAPPLFVLIGALSMTTAVLWLWHRNVASNVNHSLLSSIERVHKLHHL